MGYNFENLVVSNTGDDSLSIVDLKSHTVYETIFLKPMLKNFKNKNLYIDGLPIGPTYLEYDKTKRTLYTVNSYHNSLFKVDIKEKRIKDIVYVGSSPCHILLLNNLIFVTNSDSNSISIIDKVSFRLVENIPVGGRPHDIKFNTKNNTIYVTNTDDYSIDIISLSNYESKKIKMDCNPIHLFIGEELDYILCLQENCVCKGCLTIFNEKNENIEKTKIIDGNLVDMIIIEDKKIAYITNLEDGFLYKINIITGKIIDKYYIGGMPNTMIWNNKNMIFITNVFNNVVTLFDTDKDEILKEIKVGNEPNGLILI